MGNILTILLCLGVSGTVMVEAAGYPNHDYSLDTDPAFYPTLLAWMLLALAAILTVRTLIAWRSQRVCACATSQSTWSLNRENCVPYALIVGMFVYTFFLPLIGYGLATTLFTAFTALTFHASLKTALLTGLGAMLALEIVFRGLFDVPLPMGAGFLW